MLIRENFRIYSSKYNDAEQLHNKLGAINININSLDVEFIFVTEGFTYM